MTVIFLLFREKQKVTKYRQILNYNRKIFYGRNVLSELFCRPVVIFIFSATSTGK